MTIKKRADAAKAAIKAAEEELRALQAECSHPKEGLESVAGSNTGNYDPTADCYWINHHCLLCDKRWTEEYDR